MSEFGADKAEEVRRAREKCVACIFRVHDRLERLESLVRNEKQRLPFFREPLHRRQFELHVSVRNLRHALADLTNAMMPKAPEEEADRK